ncbi:MAG: hypothetical protein OES46_19260 [Gammaproteobacteria bacterium]|nr:hypothetical protein [Gammaproteobacteria bacterium]
MRGSLPLLLGASALLLLTVALAGPREYLFQDQRICDGDEVFCFRGTLSYHSNPRLLRLRARVQKAPGPGLLRIRLAGANVQGHRRVAPFEVRVRGHNSEIINHKMIPDYPDTYGWVVERVEFVADEAYFQH